MTLHPYHCVDNNVSQSSCLPNVLISRVRCTPQDISSWGMQSEGEWTWNNVLDTYKSLENFVPDIKPPGATDIGSGSGGEIPPFHGDGTGTYSVSSTR